MDEIIIHAFQSLIICMLWAVVLTMWLMWLNKMSDLSIYLEKYVGYTISTIIGVWGIAMFLRISYYLYELFDIKIIW